MVLWSEDKIDVLIKTCRGLLSNEFKFYLWQSTLWGFDGKKRQKKIRKAIRIGSKETQLALAEQNFHVSKYHICLIDDFLMDQWLENKTKHHIKLSEIKHLFSAFLQKRLFREQLSRTNREVILE